MRACLVQQRPRRAGITGQGMAAGFHLRGHALHAGRDPLVVPAGV